ncbi:MAG: YggN family protein, partial [Luteimonas sp.]|nr:YggN family protein [Luteimonas sp.]
AVSEADAQRLRRMEDDARALMPEVTGIARESVDITFDVLAGVVRAMTESERKARKVERYRARAQEHIDDSLGKGRWDQDVFGEKFEANVEEVMQQVIGSITRSALWAVFTGRSERLEERADRVDLEVDQLVEVRSAALEQHAQALCTQVAILREQQDALEYRYRGAPLVMLEPDAAPAAASTHAGDDDGDAARTSAIPLAQ